jgi:hypothetical protein
MDHRIGVPSRFVQTIREIEGDYFLRKEVAELLGVTGTTLKAWGEQHPRLAATGYAMIEGRRIYVYTAEDIAALRAFQLEKYPIRANGRRTRPRGAVRLWSSQEMAERKAWQRRIAYLKQRAQQAGERGEEHLQLVDLAEAEIIRTRLAAERAERFKHATRPRRMAQDWLLNAS